MPRRVTIRRRKKPDAQGKRHYYVRFNVDGTRRYFDLGVDRDTAATRASTILARYRGQAIGVRAVEPGTLRTVRDICAAYREARKGEITERQMETVKWLHDTLCDFHSTEGVVGDMNATRAGPEILQSFLLTMQARGWSESTLRHATVNAKAAMRWAVDVGAIHHNPWRTVKAKKPTRQRRRALTEAEAYELINAAKGRTAIWMELLWLTGARPSEITAARWEDVDFQAAQIVLYSHKTATRTSKPRRILLSKRALRVIDSIEGERVGLVFPPRKGTRLDRSAFRHALNRVIKSLPKKRQAHYKGVTPYTFRHSFATRMVARGVDPATLAELMGNKPATVMDWYVHLPPDHVRKALE